MRDLKALVDGLAKAKAWAGLDYSGKQRREIEADVTLGPAKDGGRVVLELSCHHDKDDKRYVASLRIVTIEKLESGFTSRRYNLSLGADNRQMAYLDRVASPRYSAKALEAFWELQIGKLQDNPELLANLDLDYNQEPQEEEQAEEGWFFARDLIKALKDEGVEDAWVWQSGGGTATFMIPRPESQGGIPVTAGPGSYNWANSELSQFTMDELYYSLDYDSYVEKYDEEPEDGTVPKTATVTEAAKLIADHYKSTAHK